MINPEMMSHTAVEPKPANTIDGEIRPNIVTKAKKIKLARKGGTNPELQKISVTNTTAALRENISD
ncbi:hypothetical protein TUM4630_02570 [Shewanella algidipiscicola]|uniref:Uncharacterized protein n=1 Tax=Shewanella algidipiscicola TaxID=614070 RepID=A0ABQ4P3X7_9GAMM|nr:hypothetical protein TUM4630_02570 [Shewanella algidipiscicola]